MHVLVDTNVLLRSAQPNHPLCPLARQAVAKMIRRGDALFVCPQNVTEFWNVATRPSDKNGLGLSVEEAQAEIDNIERLLPLLHDVPTVHVAWKGIVRRHRVRGVQVYDARLVAVMQVYAVESILTFNDSDFKRYREVTAMHPSLVAAEGRG